VYLPELLFSEKFAMETVKDRRKIWMKNPKKSVHKLNKQQTEQRCHLSNLSELSLAKTFDY